jgi:hypothetical protein
VFDRSSDHTPRGILVLLCLIALLGLVLRLGAALDYGRNWYGDGRITLVNFDEAGSCRAALDGFAYPAFVGQQTLAMAAALGLSPPEGIRGDAPAVKRWCQDDGHLLVARSYSALCGALTVLLLGLLCLMLFPAQPVVAPLAASLLALSGWHISESMVGTVDAASTAFIYGFFAAGIWAWRRGGLRWMAALLLLGAVLATKYWVFALLGGVLCVPDRSRALLLQGIDRQRGALLLVAGAGLAGLLTNPALPSAAVWPLAALFYLLPPWRALSWPGRALLMDGPLLLIAALQWDTFLAYTGGGLQGRFGSDYGAIGWNKPLRNALNLPIVMVVGLGLPATLFALAGVWQLWRRECLDRVWLVLLPLPAFALYLFFVSPVTYYRHYLPLLPALCLLAALGLAAVRSGLRVPLAAVVLLWQGALAWDLVSDYHFDPRRELPAWYAQHQPHAVLTTYYVNPPPRMTARHALLRAEWMVDDSPVLAQADTLILAENWYDTAFANELNGPRVQVLERLIKTTPAAARFYRRVLAGEDPRFELVAAFRAPTFMPELWLHRRVYGSFTQFVGDIRVFRVRS